MNLQNITPLIKKGITLELQPEKPESVEIITSPVFYVTPNFAEITNMSNPRFLLFSASGATGKSTLAKFLAYEYNAVYWNLAKAYLGESTFHGTFVKAFGFEKVLEFFSNLHNGKSLLIIDAFDEADMISGRAAVEYLLDDLVTTSNGSTGCSFILFARTETARFISSWFGARGVTYSHYEIRFFSEYYSKEFIKQKIQKKGLPITQVVTQCIDQQFVQIRRIINDDCICDSFIGYAPVLEALSTAYDEDRNTVKLLNSLQNGIESSVVISAIIRNLLIREKEKVANGLSERWVKKCPTFNKWDDVYTEHEQMFYILCIILFGEIDFSLFTNNAIPDCIYDDYTLAIRGFILDHPFIQSVFSSESRNVDFTGPAFRDYTLAYILADENNAFLAVDYLSNHQALSHCPSQLLFDFYIDFSNSRITSSFFPYLYDSFVARETADYLAGLSIFGQGEQNLAKFYLFRKNESQTCSVDYDLDVVVENDCYNFRNMINVVISVENRILIGENKSDARIANSTVVCRQIIWNATNIIVEGCSKQETLLVSREPMISSDGKFSRIVARAENECLRVSAPNVGSIHALRKYEYDFSDDCTGDLVKFTHVIRKIIGCLRKHAKDTPARDKEFIDNVIIGNSKYSKAILDFLYDSGIIYIDSKEPFLYKLNSVKSSEMGISWGQLSQGSNHALAEAYERFTSS